MAHPRYLLLLLVLCASRPGLPLQLHKADSLLSCLSAALSGARGGPASENSPLEKRSFRFPAGAESTSGGEEEEARVKEEEEKGKRTFPGVTRFKSLAQAQGKAQQEQAKSDRRTKFTLSLDVPTTIMNILFDIAKAKNLRAKAAANAQLMAQIGRRK
ncbi:urocortin-3 [Varanus komodoensis]|uniref:Urocortin 3 n=1 Tax=Varanus komodoensis TaxID=61221 RepID=A0A8D2INT6_VARKO|nr:urocortin-3 [Varanus komodoensis]